jgi:hypothetical protein
MRETIRKSANRYAPVSMSIANLHAWARYSINNGLSLEDYARGYELLKGADGAKWLQRGFIELAKTVTLTTVSNTENRAS